MRGLARGDSGPHAGAGNPFVGWVQPTANAVRPVGCTHPTAAPSSPCELRWTASCWPRSRFSARGPGWPACLDHGQGNEDVSYGPYVKEPSRQVHVVATKSLTGNPGSRPSDPRKPRRLGASSSLPARCGGSAVGSEHQMAHYPYSLQINYIPQLVFRQQAQAVLGQNLSRNILHPLDLHLHPITSKNVLSP